MAWYTLLKSQALELGWLFATLILFTRSMSVEPRILSFVCSRHISGHANSLTNMFA